MGPARQLVSHYEILEKLGEGGMGVVYKAQDLKLERVVALKFLASHLLPSRTAQMRFLQEARATSRLNHPNIATIYAVEEDGERVFLVLEYLPGGTLRELVRGMSSSGRKLPPEQVLTYAAQMAEGLAHAHRNGIWHRDVKTGNAMLSAEGIIKLTDFGLAKLTGASELTGAGARMGTAAYMSPEQVRGARMDHRSDIFSFGVVLYELATADLPFQSADQDALAHQISEVPHPPMKRPDLPADYERIVDRALQKQPQDRYESMDELAAGLRALVVPSAVPAAVPPVIEGPPTVTMTPAVHRPRRRRVLAWAGAAAAVAVSGLFLARNREADGAVSAGAPVLLAEIENRTGDAQLNALTDILRSQLSQSVRFNLVDHALVRDVLARMVKSREEPLRGDTAREVAWRSGAPLVVGGSVSQLGQRYVLNLQMEKIGNSPHPTRSWYGVFEAADKARVPAAAHAGSTWVRRIAGESATEVAQADRPAEETTTDSWQALQFFSNAERVRGQGRLDEAIALLEEAVKTDPHFALACMRLGDILTALQRQNEGWAWYRRALQEMQIRGLSKHEELRIRGLYALDTGDFPAAEAVFRAYTSAYPNDPLPLVMSALALGQEGRQDEALDQLRRAERKYPGRYNIQVHLANAYLVKGRFDDVAGCAQVLRQMGQPDWAEFLQAAGAFLQGSYDEAASRYAALANSRDPYLRNRSFLLRANMDTELGRYRHAVSVLQEGIQSHTSGQRPNDEADLLLARADLEWRRQNRTAVRDDCRRALGLDRSPQRLLRAGTVLARAGYVAEAERLAAETQGSENIFRTARWRITGEALLARGRPVEAIEEFRKADAVEPAGRPREYLARALQLAGDRDGALRLYRHIAEARNLIWRTSEPQPPGLWADALLDCALLADALGRVEEARAAASQYLKLRAGSDAPAPDLARARKIVERTTRN